MGISPFPGKEIGLFTFMHSITIRGIVYGFFLDEADHLAVIPLRKEDVSYFVHAQVYDLGAITPGR